MVRAAQAIAFARQFIWYFSKQYHLDSYYPNQATRGPNSQRKIHSVHVAQCDRLLCAVKTQATYSWGSEINGIAPYSIRHTPRVAVSARWSGAGARGGGHQPVRWRTIDVVR